MTVPKATSKAYWVISCSSAPNLAAKSGFPIHWSSRPRNVSNKLETFIAIIARNLFWWQAMHPQGYTITISQNLTWYTISEASSNSLNCRIMVITYYVSFPNSIPQESDSFIFLIHIFFSHGNKLFCWLFPILLVKLLLTCFHLFIGVMILLFLRIL